jgi:hypothetical protein
MSISNISNTTYSELIDEFFNYCKINVTLLHSTDRAFIYLDKTSSPQRIYKIPTRSHDPDFEKEKEVLKKLKGKF